MLKLPIIFLIIFLLTGCSSHRQEEVSFSNKNVSLNGTLFIPRGQGRHPAVVFVGGSGRAPRENVRWYAELFAYNGVAALIYDKRDIGSIRATELVSGDELAGDVLAAVELLKGRSDINAQHIGLWGGSQGSGIAARAAAQSKDISFLISVSGGGVTYEELATYQNANRLRAQGYSEQEIRDADAALRQLYNYVRTRRNAEAAQAALDRAWQNRWASVVLPTRRLPTEEELATWIQWREFDRTPMADWEQVTIPVLAFWGERDEVVPVQQSIDGIQQALNRAGNRNITIMIIEGADHNLMRQPNPENVPAPEYLEKMIDWTLKQTRIKN
ncbi:MAG TPA: alpha/beta hydrolase [Pyrinomonadaceae bacterium]|jgi:hypothetical protein